MAQPWELTAEEILALPLDELALHVLKDACDKNTWHWKNWLINAKVRLPDQPDALRALSEAWGWLINRGLVAGDPDQNSSEAIFISRRGRELLARGTRWLRAVERLDVELTPELEFTARPQFLRGDFEAAAFIATKEVEVAVRAAAGLSDSWIGIKLMQEAFKPPKDPSNLNAAGPLWTVGSDPGEAVATMELFKGAIGLFKNPASHRRVDLTDPTEAAEIVLLADLLLRLLKKITATK